MSATARMVTDEELEAGRFPGMAKGTFIVQDKDEQGRRRTRFMTNAEFFGWQIGRDVQVVTELGWEPDRESGVAPSQNGGA